MLTLNNRSCQIGPSVNTRTEMHGEESVPAIDLPLSAIMLSAEELNVLLAEQEAHSALFRQRQDALLEPLLKNVAPLKFTEKFEDATVNLTVGLQRQVIVLEHVKLAKLRLEPLVGGLTSLSLAVQCTPKLDKRITQLLAFLNHGAEVEIVTGKRAALAASQPELNLGNGHASAAPGKGPGDDEDDDDDAESGGKTRKGTAEDDEDDEDEDKAPKKTAKAKTARKKTVPPKKRASASNGARTHGARW